MAKISSFLFITLNGYFEGPGRDISWHLHDAEGDQLSNQGLSSGGALLFGRLTYDLMAGFWPTPAALHAFPSVAPGMNEAEKIVFSRSMKKADWVNTRVATDLLGEVRRLKQASGKDMTILGSGSILSQLAQHGLIDEFQFLVDPIALGDGTPVFEGVPDQLSLKLTASRAFQNGSLLLTYTPAPTE